MKTVFLMWLFHGYMPEFNQKGEKMSGKQLKISEKKRFPVFTFLFFFILLCVAGFMFYMAFKEQVPYWISDFKSKQVQNEYTSFGEEADGTLPYDFADKKNEKKNTKEKPAKTKNIPQDWNGVDWNGLKKMNPDIIGWIRIPDTAVNYAILKGTSDNYYLYHHMDGSYNILGSIFAEKGTSLQLEDAHTILYGHNMASGQMFGQLSNYTDTDFWKNHSYVYIYMPDRTMTFAIYDVYNCLDNDETYTIGFTLGSNDFEKWIKKTLKKGYYSTEFKPAGDEQIITLSTCADSGVINNRFVANCMLMQTELKEDYVSPTPTPKATKQK